MIHPRHVHIPRPSLKQVLLSSLVGLIGSGAVLAFVALSIVEALTHPKRKTPFDRYTLSPFEFDLPAEAVTFPPQQGDYLVNGWYIPFVSLSLKIATSRSVRGCPTSHWYLLLSGSQTVKGRAR